MGVGTTRIIAAVAVVVLIVGGGAYFLHSRNSTSNQANPTPIPTSTPQANSGEKSMMDIFTAGGNKKCTFSVSSANGGKTSGTVYVNDTKVKGDIVMTSSTGKEQNMHIIRIDDENYIWGDALPSGIKMKLSAQEFANNSQTSQAVDLNQKTNFNCTSWTVEPATYNVPANIKFIEIGSVNAPSASPTSSSATGNSSQCAACNSLSGVAKTYCISTYHCQ